MVNFVTSIDKRFFNIELCFIVTIEFKFNSNASGQKFRTVSACKAREFKTLMINVKWSFDGGSRYKLPSHFLSVSVEE